MRDRYTPDFKASALAALDANGGSKTKGAISKTAKELNIPRSTFARWVARYEFSRNSLISTDEDDIIALLREKKKNILTDELRSTGYVLLSLGDEVLIELRKKLPHMNTKELVQTMRAIATYTGITLDKVQKLESSGAGVPAIPDGESNKPDRADPFFDRAMPIRDQKAKA